MPRAAADRRGQRASAPARNSGRRAASRCGPPDLGAVAALHHRLVRRLRGVPLPVVCAVNGAAAGAGASYALACDIVLAARSARFIQAFVKIGLVPDSGASFFLPRLIGEARARALTMLGETLDAERAAEWGMIWRVVDDGALNRRPKRSPPIWRTQPTEALAAMKRMFAASATNGLHAQARPRTGPAKRGGPQRRLCRGCAGVPRETRAAVSGAA